MSQWKPRAARRTAQSPTSAPTGVRPLTLDTHTPDDDRRLDLLGQHEAAIRHAYHQHVMATDPEEGAVIAVASATDPLGAKLLRVAKRPANPRETSIFGVFREDLAGFLERTASAAATTLRQAPRGTLVVVVVALGGVTVWWLRGETSSSSWRPAMIVFGRARESQVSS